MYLRFLRGASQTNVTPVPAEVAAAAEEELEEPWMKRLACFTEERLRPVSSARDASTAAEIREAFFIFAAGDVPKKEVGLRLSRKGFAEEGANFWNGVTRTKRRVYRLRFPSGELAWARLQASTGEAP